MSILDRFFGHAYDGALKEARAVVPLVAAYEEGLVGLSDDDIRAKTIEFKARVKDGLSLDKLLPEAFALVREVAKRTLGQRHYDVQIIGGAILHSGKITEMRTGEGKTLVGTLPAYLNALSGNGVHVVTVNDYLARRDAVWMGQIYAALGLSVGVINSDGSYLYDPGHTEVDQERDQEGSYKVVYEFLRPVTRKEAYAADITYGTNNEFGFDYLRDNIEYDVANLRQREHVYAIVDEIDSILIDEARTPLIISAPTAQSEDLYDQFAQIAAKLDPATDYTIDEKLRSATLTTAGIARAEELLGVENIYTEKGIKHVHHLETAVRARALYRNNKEYVVRDGEVVIVDEFTGRMQPGRRWSDGLHQAIEAKEGVRIREESRTYASITFQNYFRQYDKLCGMTGTGLTSAEEFYTVYGLDVVPVPTHRPVQRDDKNDLIFQTEKGKFDAIAQKVRELHEKGQPVLLGTASIEKNELLSIHLTRAGVPHEVLNAKNHEREGEIIAEAGKRGGVTLATNMAGRGVDIKLGGVHASHEESEVIKSLGGLFVLGTERHDARRIDNQLRGRSGRQGDPGTTQFFVSLEDDLMRRFATDTIKGMMGRFGIPEDQPIENRMITRSLERAQEQIEGQNFDARKHVLAYDDVLNKQRVSIYARRRNLLRGSHEEVEEILKEVLTEHPEVAKALKERQASFGEERWFSLSRRLMLQVLDALWVEHLELMDYTRSSVNLRAYGQRDPLIEYRKEASRLFTELQEVFRARVAELLPKVVEEAVAREEAEQRKIAEQAMRVGMSREGVARAVQASMEARKSEHQYGRNDLVKVTNGNETKEMKFKKAEALLADGWKIVV